MKQKRAQSSIQNRINNHNKLKHNHDDDDGIDSSMNSGNVNNNTIDGLKKEKKLGPLQTILNMKRNLSNSSGASNNNTTSTTTRTTTTTAANDKKNSSIITSNSINDNNKQIKSMIDKKKGGVYIDPTIEAEDKEIQRLGRLLGINKGKTADDNDEDDEDDNDEDDDEDDDDDG